MTLDLRETESGVVLCVKVAAGSRVSGIRGVQDGSLKVSVTVAPEKGKANKAVIKLLSDQLRVPKSSIEIVSGHTASQKQLLFSGIGMSELINAIGACM